MRAARGAVRDGIRGVEWPAGMPRRDAMAEAWRVLVNVEDEGDAEGIVVD